MHRNRDPCSREFGCSARRRPSHSDLGHRDSDPCTREHRDRNHGLREIGGGARCCPSPRSLKGRVCAENGCLFTAMNGGSDPLNGGGGLSLGHSRSRRSRSRSPRGGLSGLSDSDPFSNVVRRPGLNGGLSRRSLSPRGSLNGDRHGVCWRVIQGKIRGGDASDLFSNVERCLRGSVLFSNVHDVGPRRHGVNPRCTGSGGTRRRSGDPCPHHGLCCGDRSQPACRIVFLNAPLSPCPETR